MNTPNESTALVDLHIQQPSTMENPSSAVDEARSLIIDGPEMASIAGENLVAYARMAKTIEAERVALIGPINEAHARVQAFFKRFSDPISEAISITKGKFSAYQIEQQRIADEQQKIRDAEAAKERGRLAAEAAAAQAKADAEEKRLREEAAAALEAGDAVKAAKLEARAEEKQEAAAVKVADIQMQAASTVAAVVAPTTARVSGVSKMKDNWKYVVEDESKVPREFLMIDEKKLGQYAKAMKDSAPVPGVRFYNDKSVAVRAA